MAAVAGAATSPRVEYRRDKEISLDEDVLAALVYGAPRLRSDDSRVIHVGLNSTDSAPAIEIWRAGRAVSVGRSGAIRFAFGGDFLFGCLELDERDYDDMSATAEAAYRMLMDFQRQQPQENLLRVWNHLHAINEGEGDLERYRQFCSGRARGLADLPGERLPAGTAVGRRGWPGLLQICWLASRHPGMPFGNPRQVQAWRYPRQHGPTPPSFSRGILLPDNELIGSGTASIVGHESLHAGDLDRQIEETLANLRELRRAGDILTGHSGREPREDVAVAAKVYLRDGASAATAAGRIMAGLAGAKSLLLLEADICRRELLVEIECTWA